MASALLQQPTLGLRPISKEKKAEKQKSIPLDARERSSENETKPHEPPAAHVYVEFPPQATSEGAAGALQRVIANVTVTEADSVRPTVLSSALIQ